MPGLGRKKRAGGKNGSDGEYQDDDFMPLDDLVYAPLHALANSNRQLGKDMVQAIRSMGTVQQNGQEEILHLKHLNIAYDQVRQEAEEGYHVENLKLQVPLLSVVPVSGLGIDKAEIGFSAEMKAVKQEGEYQMQARICSPEQRESDFLPRATYKLQVISIPASEGILRLADLLSTNQVVRKMDTTPIDMDVSPGSDSQKQVRQKMTDLRARMKKLKQLYQKVAEMMMEQEKMYQISRDAFEDNVYDYDRDKYQMVQSNIANRMMRCQQQMMDLEIAYGLDQDDKNE